MKLITLEDADDYMDRYADLALGLPGTNDSLSHLAARRVDRISAAREKLRTSPVDPKIDLVYYLRFDRRVKIGTTTNLRKRLVNIPHDELLALEPGGRGIERSRHDQFAELRETGEWFRMDPRLLDHIREVRRAHGLKGFII